MNAFEQMGSARTHDRFHESQDARALVNTFFPPTMQALALDLSGVTATFYGVMLQTVGDQHGEACMDAASRSFFYRLGRLKAHGARAAKQGQHLFTGDVRDIVTVLVAAIYNASPEYRFEVVRYGSDLCEVHLSGIDRYLRVARDLGIAEALTWPTLHPFFSGAAEALGIAAKVRSKILAWGPGPELHTSYVFAPMEARAPMRA